MTHKEAIDILTARTECMKREVSGKGIIDCDFRSCDECELCYAQGTTAEQIEALGMAISALQAQDATDTNTDTISRQYAIDAVAKESQVDGAYGYMDTKSIVDLLNASPSAQPEIIRCRDCKHYYYADNRIPQEQRFACGLDGDRWKPDDYCSFAERREDD